MKVLMISCAALIIPIGSALAQDVEAGQASFRKCQPCHDIGAEARNKIGPELNGLDGRKSGSVETYTYTDANKNAGIVWGEATFKEFIVNPGAKVPARK